MPDALDAQTAKHVAIALHIRRQARDHAAPGFNRCNGCAEVVGEFGHGRLILHLTKGRKDFVAAFRSADFGVCRGIVGLRVSNAFTGDKTCELLFKSFEVGANGGAIRPFEPIWLGVVQEQRELSVRMSLQPLDKRRAIGKCGRISGN